MTRNVSTYARWEQAIDQRAATKRPATERVAPALTELLIALVDVPAVVLGRRSDVLAWNDLGHALLAGTSTFRRGRGDPPTEHGRVVIPRRTLSRLYVELRGEGTRRCRHLRLVRANTPTILRSLHSSAG